MKTFLRRIANRVRTELLLERKESFHELPFSSCGFNPIIAPPYRVFNPEYISIGDNFTALYNLRLEAIVEYAGGQHRPELVIGNSVSFGSDVHIGCIGKLVIEDGVLLASRIFISDHFHGRIASEELSIPPNERLLYSKGPVRIGRNAWIGVGACILPGVSIGESAIIGANAVVANDVPPRAVVAGVPAKVLRVLD